MCLGSVRESICVCVCAHECVRLGYVYVRESMLRGFCVPLSGLINTGEDGVHQLLEPLLCGH